MRPHLAFRLDEDALDICCVMVPTGILGADQGRPTAAGAASLAHAAGRRTTRPHPRVQRVGGSRVGGAGTPVGQSRSPRAGRGQLHRRDGASSRAHHRHWKRSVLQAAWTQALQSVQRTSVTQPQRGATESRERARRMPTEACVAVYLPGRHSKAIRFPSGDQEGRAEPPGGRVSCRRALPSTFIT